MCVCVQMQMQNKLRSPGLEPGPGPWQGPIIPLDYERCDEEVTGVQICNGYIKKPGFCTSRKMLGFRPFFTLRHVIQDTSSDGAAGGEPGAALRTRHPRQRAAQCAALPGHHGDDDMMPTAS